MSQFASADELSSYMGVDLDFDRADQYLQLATAAVQSEARQRFELVEDDPISLQGQAEYVGDSWALRLPQRPVVDVTEVRLGGIVLTGFTVHHWGVAWSGSLPSWASFQGPTLGGGTVEVTYSHGYDEIPDDVKGVVLDVAQRAYTDAQAEPAAPIGMITLTDAEKLRLRDYRMLVL